ncbi:MAG: hypothetical protein V1910_01080 [bacterium]
MKKIIIMSLFMSPLIYGGSVIMTDADTVSISTISEFSSKIEEKTIVKVLTREELEKKAKAYFKDTPILVDIARCESKFRHLDKNGDILRGEINKGDLGLMQINEYYHMDKSKKLGLDIKTLEGNMAYAKYLYEREGSRPWLSSSKCWRTIIDSKVGNQIALNK